MKTKPCIYLQPNYLLFRTAIGAVSGTIGVLAVVIASTGFVNFKSGILIQSNRSGNKKTVFHMFLLILENNINLLEENNNEKNIFLFFLIKYVFTFFSNY